MAGKSYENAFIIGLDWQRWEPMVGPMFANRIARSSAWARAGLACFLVWFAMAALTGRIRLPEPAGGILVLIAFSANIVALALLFVSAYKRGKVALSIRDDLKKAGYALNEPPTLYRKSSFLKWCDRHNLSPELVQRVGAGISDRRLR
jgi:hypothetical protein